MEESEVEDEAMEESGVKDIDEDFEDIDNEDTDTE